ncbi:2-keto-3-deoxygluconate kinase [Micromonospora globispora]|uniref:2-keto-3-deoxygluconate kinase n=3 Tax=Micromonospora globispora TaxID=1450148 RepID=A0A317KAP1_9ACTN|nr:PfkB family carbohydrate kinase [Micromonospora globispora]PWU50237.1 2-keto-3-deoxygluconate kinase [Micromonospora globispora]
MVTRTAPDVLVFGEILVELTALEPLRDGAALRLGFSGDALNAAGAAAAAGAHTALLARVPDDELGDELVARVAALGVDTSRLIRTRGQHGLYLQHADPAGQREFVYVRRGSAGSSLAAADVPEELAAGAGVVLSSGVACAISTTAFEAVRAAASAARCFVYDPNWRPRLADADTAAGHLRALAPYARVVTPAWPREAAALLGTTMTGPVEACAAFRALGAGAVALTQGDNGVLLDDGGELTSVPAYPAEQVVDQTGAGDVLAGTVAARLALGDDLPDAIRLGAAAAALSLRGQGGTGYLPDLAESRRLVTGASTVEVSG